VVGLPALSECGFNLFMDQGLVQSQEGEFVGVRGFRQLVKEWNDVFSPDVVFVKLEMPFSLGVVQGPNGLDPLAAKAECLVKRHHVRLEFFDVGHDLVQHEYPIR